MNSSLPTGVFDSGVGGLSVLLALRAELPCEEFVYVADSGHAPYGERDDIHVLARSLAVTQYLIKRHAIKALVVACNTATAAAIQTLRRAYPHLPIVGIEPSLKPAVALSRTGFIGVLATRGTLGSEKFSKLLHSLQGEATFVLQACDGLATAIEQHNVGVIANACVSNMTALGTFGSNAGEIDTLVLGCTHYPFIADRLLECAHYAIHMVDGGAPVARQTRRLLTQRNALVRPPPDCNEKCAVPVNYLTTSESDNLSAAIARWMRESAPVTTVRIPDLSTANNLSTNAHKEWPAVLDSNQLPRT